MKTVSGYLAFDETFFYTEEECAEYEKNNHPYIAISTTLFDCKAMDAVILIVKDAEKTIQKFEQDGIVTDGIEFNGLYMWDSYSCDWDEIPNYLIATMQKFKDLILANL